jgi:biopolymer transport protein TolR
MAMSIAGKSGGGRRRGRSSKSRPMSEINVTPLVDVMLVLLIVFMVAAPLMTVGVPIDLPQTQAKELNTESKPISVTVSPAGEIFLQDQKVELEALVEQIAVIAPNGTEERIFVRGDQSANYGEVMRLMGVLSAAGYTKIGLVTAQDQVR